MTDYTIANTFTLPSLGKVYDREINPQVTLRSMTTADEMKRLNRSERTYLAMSDVLDSCITNDIGISAYDLCLADYQFLTHKLRIITYGTQYSVNTRCPFCASDELRDLDLLNDITFTEFDPKLFERYSSFELPACGKKIKLRMQSPRLLDDISLKVNEIKKTSKGANGDPAFLYSIASMIDTIDEKHYEDFEIIEFVRNLPMLDTNYIIKASDKLNNFFGLNPIYERECEVCRLTYKANFQITPEFFGPSIDI